MHVARPCNPRTRCRCDTIAATRRTRSRGPIIEPTQPDFTEGSELLDAAYRFAYESHHGPAREGDTDIEHPVAVARILAAAGFDDEVVASALLHDVVEDTAQGSDEILTRFPGRIAELVAAMTEDDSIGDYRERKAEHRGRVLAAGAAPATIYLADKVARVERYLSSGEPVWRPRLEHYRATLEEFEARDPTLPLLARLRSGLEQLAERETP